MTTFKATDFQQIIVTKKQRLKLKHIYHFSELVVSTYQRYEKNCKISIIYD